MGKCATVSIRMRNARTTATRMKRVFEKAVLPKLAERILADCNAYVRTDRGTLRDSAHIVDGGKRIVWSTPYARRVYYTGTPSRRSNPCASLRWCEAAARKHSADWARQAGRLLKGGGTE